MAGSGSACGTSVAGRNTNRSRSPSDRYIIPRLSLQNKDDVELSPRAPLSPRGNPPAAPYMSSTPRSVSADNLHKPLERISPRFGPLDENHPDKLPSQNGRLASAKRNGGGAVLTSSTSSASKIRTALRDHSASSVRSTARERRPNPLLGNSPPARAAPVTSSPSKVNQSRVSDSGSSSGSSEHSGPSLGSKTVVLRSGMVTPNTSTTSLVMHGGQRIPAGVGTSSATAAIVGDELRRTSCDGSRRSCPEGHPRSSVPISTAGSEDFQALHQGLSQGGPLPPVEAEDQEVSPLGSEHVEFLCQKAQSLVRQMGANAWTFETGPCSRPPSARSSPCIKVSPPLASPCTPCPRSDGLQMKFSPSHPRPALPDITNLQREDLTELKQRLSQVEQVLKLGPPAASSEVLKLRGRMQTVESELVDVRAELKEVRMAVSRFTSDKQGETKTGPIRACHTVMASPAMPSPKQIIRLHSHGTAGGQAAVAADQFPLDKSAPAPSSPRKQLPRAPITAATFSPFQQTRAGVGSPGACFMQRMTMHVPPQVVSQPPQTVRVHPALRPPSGLVIPQPVPLHLGQWHMTTA